MATLKIKSIDSTPWLRDYPEQYNESSATVITQIDLQKEVESLYEYGKNKEWNTFLSGVICGSKIFPPLTIEVGILENYGSMRYKDNYKIFLEMPNTEEVFVLSNNCTFEACYCLLGQANTNDPWFVKGYLSHDKNNTLPLFKKGIIDLLCSNTIEGVVVPVGNGQTVMNLHIAEVLYRQIYGCNGTNGEEAFLPSARDFFSNIESSELLEIYLQVKDQLKPIQKVTLHQKRPYKGRKI